MKNTTTKTGKGLSIKELEQRHELSIVTDAGFEADKGRQRCSTGGVDIETGEPIQY